MLNSGYFQWSRQQEFAFDSNCKINIFSEQDDRDCICSSCFFCSGIFCIICHRKWRRCICLWHYTSNDPVSFFFASKIHCVGLGVSWYYYSPCIPVSILLVLSDKLRVTGDWKKIPFTLITVSLATATLRRWLGNVIRMRCLCKPWGIWVWGWRGV